MTLAGNGKWINLSENVHDVDNEQQVSNFSKKNIRDTGCKR